MQTTLLTPSLHQRAWRWLCAIVAVLALASCGGGDGPTAEPAPPPPSAQAASVTVKVVDALGFVKPGAVVSVVNGTGTEGITGANGQTRIDLPADQDVLLQVTLAGHTRQFRPLRVGAGHTAFLQTTLLARAPALTLPDAAAGGTLVGKNAARLTLPPGALVDAISGTAVSGPVQVEMTPVNTNSHEIAAFPGSMRAMAGTTEGQLVTYGPVEYVFTQGGRRLQLAPGQSAVIEMPLHATLDIDGTPLEVGDTMPVWSLNETTGVWLQEGTGTVVASASATGLALRATVSHFSWWNPDHFSNARQVNISFVFEDGVVPTACCDVEAETTPGFDGPSGLASTTLPVTGGTVVVDTPSLYTFTARGLSDQGPLFGGVLDINIPDGNGPFNLTITLAPDPDAPNPVITSPAAGVTAYARDALNVQASVSGDEPDTVVMRVSTLAVGALTGSQAGGYSFNWPTTGYPEGTYTFDVRATRGTTVVTSTTRTVVVDRTPPQVVGRAPAPGFGQTDAGAVVVATFNEPIAPDSLDNPNDPAALRTELRLGGQPDGTLIPATVTLSVDGLSLNLAPQTPLTGGNTYSVFIEGLTDRAGNTMAPETWSFTVPLFGFVGPDLTVLEDSTTATVVGRPALALDNSGQPVVGWGSSVNNQSRIQVRRFVAPLWVSLPPLIPSAPLDPFGSIAMVLDQAGQPVVAWTQNTPNTPASNCGSNVFAPQLFAARFNGIGWSPLGAGDLNLSPCSNPTRPRLALDLANRPVVVALEGTLGRTVRVQRFGGSGWELLGSIPPRAPSAVSNVDLDLALDGNLPVVLVSENRLGPIDHFVTRLNNGVAEPLGGLIATGNVAGREPALALDSLGRPVVALQLSSSELRVHRFEGGSWGTLGPALPTPGGGVRPSLVFSGTEPRVTYHETLVFPSPASTRLYDNTLAIWSDPLTMLNTAGTISRAARAPTGPTWLAATTGPFNRELRVIRSDTLP